MAMESARISRISRAGLVLEVPASYRPSYVIDASIVVKWFAQEDDSPLALQLLKDCLEGRRSLIAPSVLFYEVANALKFNPNLMEEDVKRALDRLEAIPIGLVTYGATALVRAFQLAKERDLTIYDAVYLDLALVESIPLITADRILLQRGQAGGIVLQLSDFYYCN